ncbi:energy-coupling factor ABC transporter ATP-binding protein [Breznakiellaceae bacterium SP9]
MVLAVSELSVVYPGSNEGHVLQHLSFSIEYGQKVALIGANGAGKSTLLLTLVGVLPIHDGSICVEHTKLDKRSLSYIRQKLGLVFQNPDDQLFMPSVFEDVLFGPKNMQREGAAQKTGANNANDIKNKCLALMEQLGIAHLKDRMSHKLSGGEKRLAALCSVLAMEPSMLLMDEPSAFLDPRTRRRTINLIKSLPQACLIATHDLAMATDIASRILFLHKGTIAADCPAPGLLQDSQFLESIGL